MKTTFEIEFLERPLEVIADVEQATSGDRLTPGTHERREIRQILLNGRDIFRLIGSKMLNEIQYQIDLC